LYGDALMVAPVLQKGVTERSVYFPRGRWLEYRTRSALYAGPGTARVQAPIGAIPVFAREGAIIPRGDILRANNNWTADWAPRLRVEIYPAEAAPSLFQYRPGEEAPALAGRPRAITCSPTEEGITVRCEDLGV